MCIRTQRTKVFRRHQFVCVCVLLFFAAEKKTVWVGSLCQNGALKGVEINIRKKQHSRFSLLLSSWSLPPVFKCTYTTTTQFTDCFSPKNKNGFGNARWYIAGRQKPLRRKIDTREPSVERIQNKVEKESGSLFSVDRFAFLLHAFPN